MFIAFEGIEQSGKSTLSVKFTSYLNKSDEDGLLKIDPHFGDFIWTKEPSFSPEEANKLNTSPYMDEYRRERLFFESRIRHQNQLAGKNVVCERYLWSGLAYAHRYSKDCFRFLKELYTSDSLFIPPDLYVFINTPVEVCCERDPSLDIDIQKELQASYTATESYIKVPILRIEPLDDEDATVNLLINLFEEYHKK